MVLKVNNSEMNTLAVDGVTMDRLYVDDVLVFDKLPISILNSGTAGSVSNTSEPHTFTATSSCYLIVTIISTSANSPFTAFANTYTVHSDFGGGSQVELTQISASNSCAVYAGAITSPFIHVTWTQNDGGRIMTWIALSDKDTITLDDQNSATGTNNLSSLTSSKDGSFFLAVGHTGGQLDTNQCTKSPTGLTTQECWYHDYGGTDAEMTNKIGYIADIDNGTGTGSTHLGTSFSIQEGFLFKK